jgi:hypothetical protein
MISANILAFRTRAHSLDRGGGREREETPRHPGLTRFANSIQRHQEARNAHRPNPRRSRS